MEPKKYCPCCGNARGCDCYLQQSAQYRRIAELEAAAEQEAKADSDIQEMLNKYMEDAARFERERDEAKAALAEERELLDGAADVRIVDGIGGIDIDEATLAALPPNEPGEKAWNAEWRKQFRIALRAAIDEALKRHETKTPLP